MTLSPQQSSYAVITKKFSYLLVKTGTLMLKARSDLRGYIPGQVIKLATEIHNKSGKDTGCVLASLIQVAAGLLNINVFFYHLFFFWISFFFYTVTHLLEIWFSLYWISRCWLQNRWTEKCSWKNKEIHHKIKGEKCGTRRAIHIISCHQPTDLHLHSLCPIPNISMSAASVHCPLEISILEGVDLLEMCYKSLLGLRSFKHNHS